MDFFERQARARRTSGRLIAYFVLAVGLIALSVYLVLALMFLRAPAGAGLIDRLWHTELFLGAILGTLAIVGTGSLFKIMQISRGGAVVATTLGGRPLDTQSADPDERKLLNVVEEMAIASGLPVPEVYLLEREEGINAFAAGFAPGDAVIGVTRGCMRLLSRDELQGVIAHEFSHILNGDMRLNIRLIGLLNGILCLALIGRVMVRMVGGRSSDRKGGNPLPLIGLALLVLGAIGVFFGRLIKSAVSRQREFLADAAAVQFTRNPDGLVGALKKIGAISQGSRVTTPSAEEASHLFFGNALSRGQFGWFTTHPPLIDRIRVWEPGFGGDYPKLKPAGIGEGGKPVSLSGRAGPRPVGDRLPPILAGVAGTVAASQALAHVGQPTSNHLEYANTLMSGLPDRLRHAAHEPMTATALVYALMLSPDNERRQHQLTLLTSRVGEPVLAETNGLLATTSVLDRRLRLPLVELCLPALRRLSPSQYATFEQGIVALIAADRQIEIHEYALQHVLRRHLEPHFKETRRRAVQYYVVRPLLPDLKVVLSVLAHTGSDTDEGASAAFLAGWRRLHPDRGDATGPLSLSSANLVDLDAALDRLALAAPPLRKQILQSCADTVAADGEIRTREAELLRAIADALDCPLPPFLAVGRSPADTTGSS